MKFQLLLNSISEGFFTYFRLFSRTLGIIALTIFDITISGVALYIIFKDVPEITGWIVAGAISFALTSISIYLWQEVQETKKRTISMWAIIVVVAILQIITYPGLFGLAFSFEKK